MSSRLARGLCMLAAAVGACASASLARAHSVELKVGQLAAPPSGEGFSSAIYALELKPLPSGLGLRIAPASRRMRAAEFARPGASLRLERGTAPARRIPAPEPTSLVLFLAGAAGMARVVVRRR